MDYTDEELKLFDELTDDLILWMFNTNDKRHAINKIIQTAYDKGKELKQHTKKD